MIGKNGMAWIVVGNGKAGSNGDLEEAHEAAVLVSALAVSRSGAIWFPARRAAGFARWSPARCRTRGNRLWDAGAPTATGAGWQPQPRWSAATPVAGSARARSHFPERSSPIHPAFVPRQPRALAMSGSPCTVEMHGAVMPIPN